MKRNSICMFIVSLVFIPFLYFQTPENVHATGVIKVESDAVPIRPGVYWYQHDDGFQYFSENGVS